MTSINIIERPDVVYLFSDGASYDLDGVLQSITGKTHVLSGLSTAMLFSGQAIAAPIIAFLLERRATDFDHLKRTISKRLPFIEDQVTELFDEDPAGKGFRIFVAGWSNEKGRPSSFAIGSVPFGDLPPYAVIEPRGSGWQAPGLSDEQRELGFGGPPLVNAETIRNVAITTLELQRQEAFAKGEVCKVGGLVELVEVRRDRIDVRIVHRWADDRVGELICPSSVNWEQWRKDYPVNDPAAGLSPLKRAMLEKKLRKGKLRAA